MIFFIILLFRLQVIASGLIVQPLVTLVHSRDPKLEPENIPMRSEWIHKVKVHCIRPNSIKILIIFIFQYLLVLPIIMDVLKTSWKRDPVQIFLFVNLENLQEHSTHLNGPVVIRQECMTTNSKSKIVWVARAICMMDRIPMPQIICINPRTNNTEVDTTTEYRDHHIQTIMVIFKKIFWQSV